MSFFSIKLGCYFACLIAFKQIFIELNRGKKFRSIKIIAGNLIRLIKKQFCVSHCILMPCKKSFEQTETQSKFVFFFFFN